MVGADWAFCLRVELVARDRRHPHPVMDTKSSLHYWLAHQLARPTGCAAADVVVGPQYSLGSVR